MACTNVRESVYQKFSQSISPGPQQYDVRPIELESTHSRAPAWSLPVASRSQLGSTSHCK